MKDFNIILIAKISLLYIIKNIYFNTSIGILFILLFPFQIFYILDNLLIFRFIICFVMENWLGLSNQNVFNVLLLSLYLSFLILLGNLFLIVWNFNNNVENIDLTSWFVLSIIHYYYFFIILNIFV